MSIALSIRESGCLLVTFVLLRDLVHERTGLFFADDKSDTFFSKLAPLVEERGFSSLLDYYYALKNDPASADEWRKRV